MANRFWVGGGSSNNWSATAPTNWSASSGGAGNASVPGASDNATFDAASGSGTVTIGTTTRSCINFDSTNSTNTFAGSSQLNISGNLTLGASNVWASGYSGLMNLTGSGATITPNGKAVDCPVTFNGTSWTLAGNFTTGATRTTTLTAGTLDLTTKVWSTGLFATSGSTARQITTGAGGGITLTGNNGTIWTCSTRTNFTLSGRLVVTCSYSGATGTRTLTCGTTGATEANSMGFAITAGTDVVAPTGTHAGLDFTGFTGSWTVATATNYGGLITGTGMSHTGTSTQTFSATSGTWDVKGNGVTWDFGVAMSMTTATMRLTGDVALGATRTFSFNTATLNLNGHDLSANIFSGGGASTRDITAGGGTITVTGNSASVFVISSTAFTLNDALQVIANYSGSSGTRTFTTGIGLTEANTPSISVTNGTDIVSIGQVKNLNFTGFTGSWTSASAKIFGSLTFTAGMTYTGGVGSTLTFAATSGTKVITSAGQTFNRGVTFDGAGGTWQLADAFICSGQVTLTNGTWDTNGKAVSLGNFATASGTKTLTLGASVVSISGTFDNNSGNTNLTVTSNTGKFKLTTTGGTFVSAGRDWNGADIWLSGNGTFLLTGDGTFDAMVRDTPPQTLQFQDGSSWTFNSWSGNGTAGNLMTLTNQSGSTAATINLTSGTVHVSYYDISWSTGAPASTWFADDGTSIDSTHNTGWTFGGTDASVALTGFAITSSLGTLAITVDDTDALVGFAITSSLGTLTPIVSVDAPLIGFSITSSLGTLAVTVDDTDALVGFAITSSLGLLSPRVDFSFALSGFAITSALGTLTPSVSDTDALVGFAITSSLGTLSPRVDFTIPLVGFGVASALGTLVAFTSDDEPLIGFAITSSLGILSPRVDTSLALAGFGTTATLGTLTPSVSDTDALIGFVITSSLGSFGLSLERPLVGFSMNSSLGLLGPQTDTVVALQGFGSTLSLGQLTPSTSDTDTLVGFAIAASLGTLTPSHEDFFNILVGFGVGVSFGQLGISHQDHHFPLSGFATTCSLGALHTSGRIGQHSITAILDSGSVESSPKDASITAAVRTGSVSTAPKEITVTATIRSGSVSSEIRE